MSDSVVRPSAEEWPMMTSHSTFIVKDDQDESHRFSVGNYAIIVPYGKAPDEQIEDHEYWVGKIKEIRSRNGDPSEVWALVQWFYSGPDIAEVKPSFDSTSCAKMERFISNGKDYIHSSCFQGLVKCIFYDESDTEQPMIDEDTFFYRSSFNANTKRIRPTLRGTCLCDKIYNPDTTALMHFCPRNTCQKAFHAACLEKANSKEFDDIQRIEYAPRHIQFERTLPHTSVKYTKDQIVLNGGEDEDDRSRSTVDGGYEYIPEDLLALARSPMVKGKKLPAGGVVGNIPFVMRARQLLSKILQCGPDMTLDWEADLDLDDLEVTDLIAKDANLLCPECGGAI